MKSLTLRNGKELKRAVSFFVQWEGRNRNEKKTME